MAIDRGVFFDRVRQQPMFGGSLKQSQVDAMNAILAVWDEIGYRDVGHIAYTLATARHEAGPDMRPVREAYGSTDEETIRRLDAAWAAGKLGNVSKPYWRRDASGKAWFGRGLPQLTHRDNYERMSREIGIDLVANPSRMLEISVSARALVIGMIKGMFRGVSLNDRITPLKRDYVAARDIVNGKRDKADLIASYAVRFEAALRAAETAPVKPAPPSPIPPPPDIEPRPPAPQAPASGPPWAAVITAIAAAAGAAAAWFFGE